MTIADVYLIHFNGGRPYKCVVSGTQVRVYRFVRYDENHDPMYYQDPALVLQGIPWIGKDAANPDANGNSILVVHTDGSVTYIGSSVFTFEPRSPIRMFQSPIGNNDVPYPYALDQRGNYYFLAENAVVLGARIVNRDDPYSHDGGLYGLMKMTGFEGIVQYVVPGPEAGGPYGISWSPCVSHEFQIYDRNYRYIGDADHIVVYKRGGVQERMTRDQLQQLYDRFAAQHGLADMGAIQLQ